MDHIMTNNLKRCNTNLLITTIILLVVSITLAYFIYQSYGLGLGLGITLPILIPGLLIYYLSNKLYHRFKSHTSNPIYTQLSRFGDPSEVLIQIENQVGQAYTKYGAITVSQDWLIIERLFTTKVIHRVELLWSYEKTTRHSINFIPTGSTHSIIICHSQSGYKKNKPVVSPRDHEVSMTEKEVKSLLLNIHQIAPWCILGYSEEISKIWHKTPLSLYQHVNQKILELTQKK